MSRPKTSDTTAEYAHMPQLGDLQNELMNAKRDVVTYRNDVRQAEKALIDAEDRLDKAKKAVLDAVRILTN